MHILILGGTGAVGRLTLQHLLDQGHRVTALVRRTHEIPAHERLVQHLGTALECDAQWLANQLDEVDVVISCLGHRVTLSGLFGHPRRLVRDSLDRVLNTLAAKPNNKTKVILLGSSGCQNPLLNERQPMADRIALTLVRHLVPPHADNEQAARLLAEHRSRRPELEWVAVRPDTLTNADESTPYQAVPSPKRSPIFNPGKTSRINVAHFIGSLINDESVWAQWKHQMPILYNAESVGA